MGKHFRCPPAHMHANSESIETSVIERRLSFFFFFFLVNLKSLSALAHKLFKLRRFYSHHLKSYTLHAIYVRTWHIVAFTSYITSTYFNARMVFSKNSSHLLYILYATCTHLPIYCFLYIILVLLCT